MSTLITAVLLTVSILGASGPALQQASDPGQQNVIPGEYLAVTTRGWGMWGTKKKFSSYGVKEFTFIGKRILKIKLERDPGIEEVRRIASGCSAIRSIEPNRRMGLQPPIEQQ